MFDNAQCIQEIIPGEDLPESHKKRSEGLINKNSVDEGIELQVLKDRKPNETGCDGSFNEQSDEDSIMSIDEGARAASSTIDLKVDVHRKNSSEGSEELSLNLVGEVGGNCTNEIKADESGEKSQGNTQEREFCNLRCKHNKLRSNKCRLKTEIRITGYDGDDFILSQSDCYIAKQRKKSLNELSREYKMSRSECHISNFGEGLNIRNDVKSIEDSTCASEQSHFSGRGTCMGHCTGMFCSHLDADNEDEQNISSIEKNRLFNLCNLVSNGSCGILSTNQNTEKDVINTGSLDLPLKDSGSKTGIDKGLLYWKQHNFGRKSQKYKEALTLYKKSNPKINSDSNISFSSSHKVNDKLKVLDGNFELNVKESLHSPTCHSEENNITSSSESKENSFLRILEENFDWCGCEYDNKTDEKLGCGNVKEKEKGKCKCEDDIKERKKCGLKFQVDSDEDLSDNRGSQSPLLCRHESLKKSDFPSLTSSGSVPGSSINRIPRSYSGDENNSCQPNKLNRTLSVDENTVAYDSLKTNRSLDSENDFFVTVYDDRIIKVYGRRQNEGSNNTKKTVRIFGDDELEPSPSKCVPIVESYPCRNQTLSLVSYNKTEPEIVPICQEEKDECSERGGLNWLFEGINEDGDGDVSGKTQYLPRDEVHNKASCDSQNTKSNFNRGAIPKTKLSETVYCKKSVRRKKEERHRTHQNKQETLGSRQPTKIERENDVIDEEDMDVAKQNTCRDLISEEAEQPQGSKESPWRETYDSSGNSTTELSSLLPLSSLLSSFHPPTSPLLAAFLATRKEIAENSSMSTTVQEIRDDRGQQNVSFVRNRHKRNKRTSRTQRSSRSSRVSSLPLVALASVVSSNSGTHLATSHDDTSQGAVHCFQDERGNWMSYTFDSQSISLSHFPILLGKSNDIMLSEDALRQINDSSINNTGGYSRCFQPSRRTSCVQLAIKRERDLSLINFVSSHPGENSIRDQSIGSECSRLKCVQESDSYGADKNKKPTETWDPIVNLVSNSNSENDSSLSLNSAAISPNIETATGRPTFASFVRERFIANQSNPSSSSSSSIINFTGSISNSVLVNLNDFRGYVNNDNNNNISNNNNTNNDSINPSNRRGNFYSEGTNNPMSMRSHFGLITETFLDSTRQRAGAFHSLMQDSQLPVNLIQHGSEQDRSRFGLFDYDDLDINADVKKKPKHYYKLHYSPWSYVKIRFDRLELTALLDRNLTLLEVFLSLFLSVTVSICGIILLNYGFYRDLFAFLFCFTLAGCQYSLLKSVQPDATSPTHGYNRVVIYSRSIYFCATSLLILLLTNYLNRRSNNFSFQFYNIHITNNNLVRTTRDGLVNLLLFFPILFTLGFFPQINTFCLYVLEQVDMHVFGGNAMSSLVGAAYCILRSTVTVIFIYGFAYGALSEVKTSQHILFSIFCGLLVSFSYHLSRSSSNPNIFWDILKEHLFQDEFGSKPYGHSGDGKTSGDVEKSVDESNKSDVHCNQKDRSSRNNLLPNSNPSFNDDGQTKSASSDAFESSMRSGEDDSSFDVGSGKGCDKEEFVDPLPCKMKQTVNSRLRNDVIVCSLVAVVVFGIHCSTIFTILQPDLNPILWGIAGCSGIVLHYIVPELRKHLPWLCLAGPVLKSHEHTQFEVKATAKVMWFEETYVILCFFERNLLYPVLVLATLTYDGPRICNKFGVPLGTLITCLCGLKVMRSAFSNTPQQYLIVIFSALLFEFDFHSCSETFLVDYFFMGIIFSKTYEFLLKVQFVVIYIAPWQITWGSAFHAFAQPFSVPHSAMLFIQAAISAILSAPLNPFLGSAIFLASYVRPIKFWERDYNTKRVDHSNTRMSSHLERNLGSDDNNLNSIFYEHLTRSLQRSLCGDLELGRWGPVYQGDCFVLASDYLNCLVHIIEVGNGLVTFQMRGLEFRGTYCQQREVEAISERVEDDDGCCCCEPCHIPHILSVNAAFSKRWLAWEVTASKYVLEGYSISDNSAASTLQVFDFRKVLVTYYVKSIIFYCVRSPKLKSWLTNPTILSALEPLADRSFVDLDPVFNINIDQDFDIRAEGITRNSFCSVYLEWIQYCCSKREKPIDKALDSSLVSLCLALSLIGRRTLGTASHNTVSSVEFFLYGLHALFKGDFRITSIRDDWIFADMEFLVKVVAPGVRMSLKLHQDHFMSPDEYENPSTLFDAISHHEENLVISHEGDPAWRSAVLSGKPSLLALRHVLDDGSDEYKIIMLNKRYLSFRVIKLNRECVRGLWAGQQQELVFLRNRNPERGSIQNAKQVLRNMINSSCDQPIGYPIYVSPLTTSYSDTNNQLTGIIGGPLSLQGLKKVALKIWKRIRQRCREGCSSGSIVNADEGGCSLEHEGIHAMTNLNVHPGHGHNTSGSQSMDSSQMQLSSSNRGGSLGRSSLGGRGSIPSVGKPSSTTLASLAAELPKAECFLRERETSFTFIKERQNREEKEMCKRYDDKREKDDKEKKKDEKDFRKEKNLSGHFDDSREREIIYQRVRIIHPNLVFDAINLGRRIDVLWPDEGMRLKGGRSYWKDWLPDTGMEGQVVHRWVPNHRDPAKRSNVDKTILLVKVEDKYVPIAEAGVQDLGVEV
ncbi:hypothetical protein RUM43_011610 [Polyplax serrata]|uniref:Pecanex-like protein n=1 Tax=Polyplax serrata TaxID=468196 RepID=A0AAN8S3R7_POLSC